MNIKLTVAYEGTHYLGWQKTAMGPSIEQTLQEVLEQILQEKLSLQAASRTDRGVHAMGQVVNFISKKTEIDLYKLQKSLNALLPRDISILHAEYAHDSFHPTLDAVSKEYQYTICMKKVQLPFHRLFSWHIPHPIDLEVMEKACVYFLGTHDFAAFCNELSLYGKDTVCTIEQLFVNLLPMTQLQIIIRGNRFLYKMVRNIVGTLIYIGAGNLSLSSLPKILEARQRPLAGVTAPAQGLLLNKIFYL